MPDVETAQFGPFSMEIDPAGKPPLLLVHGFLSSRHNWLLNVAALRAQFRLIVVELPGHGAAAPCVDPAALHPDAMLAALEEARRAHSVERWRLCGHSLGAAITIRYALAHPERVVAQVWTNSNSAMRPPFDDAARTAHAERIETLRRDREAAVRRQGFHPRFAKRFPEDIRQILSADADGCDVDTLVAMLENTTPFLPLRDRLAQLTVPTLLTNGVFERGFQPMRELAARTLPTMTVIDLKGGHSINIEQAEAFNAAVLDFFAEAKPTR